jgi:hypothetical protein
MKSAAAKVTDIGRSDQQADFQYFIGKAFETLGDKSRAKRHYQMSLEVIPDSVFEVRARNALIYLDRMSQFRSVQS